MFVPLLLMAEAEAWGRGARARNSLPSISRRAAARAPGAFFFWWEFPSEIKRQNLNLKGGAASPAGKRRRLGIGSVRMRARARRGCGCGCGGSCGGATARAGGERRVRRAGRTFGRLGARFARRSLPVEAPDPGRPPLPKCRGWRSRRPCPGRRRCRRRSSPSLTRSRGRHRPRRRRRHGRRRRPRYRRRHRRR